MFNCSLISNTPYGDAGHPDRGTEIPEVQRVHINDRRLDLVRIAEKIYEDGHIPVPLRRWSDQPAVGLNRWIDLLSVERIREHFRKFPHDGLGVIR